MAGMRKRNPQNKRHAAKWTCVRRRAVYVFMYTIYIYIGVCVYIQGDYLDVWNTTSVFTVNVDLPGYDYILFVFFFFRIFLKYVMIIVNAVSEK